MPDSSRDRLSAGRPSPTDLALRLEPIPVPDLPVPTDGWRVEFLARGERVVARLRLASQGQGPAPLALFLHDQAEPGPDGDKLDLLQAGAAILELNWPLMGARRSPKMSEQLVASLAQERKGGTAALLARQFAAQAIHEFSCLLAVADEIEAIDAHRILRVDLTLSLENSVPGSDPSPIQPAVRKVLEAKTGELEPTQACAAVEEYISQFVD